MARVRYSCNWRSFTEMQRKRNARMCLPGDSAQLAFIHRDVAEKERQFADGGAGAGGTSGKAGSFAIALSTKSVTLSSTASVRYRQYERRSPRGGSCPRSGCAQGRLAAARLTAIR